jgi:hypothetical protein
VNLPTASTATVWTTGPPSFALAAPGAAVVVVGPPSTGGSSDAGIRTTTVAPSRSAPVTVPATLAGWPTSWASRPVTSLPDTSMSLA